MEPLSTPCAGVCVYMKIRISELIPLLFSFSPFPPGFFFFLASMLAGLVIKLCPTLGTLWTTACQAPLSMGLARNIDVKWDKNIHRWLTGYVMVIVRKEIGPSFSENSKLGHFPQVGVEEGPRRPPESAAPALSQEKGCRTPLMVQWLRIRLPAQGTWVRFLLPEDSTCHGAAEHGRHNYWSYPRLEPVLHNKRSPQSERPSQCHQRVVPTRHN